MQTAQTTRGLTEIETHSLADRQQLEIESLLRRDLFPNLQLLDRIRRSGVTGSSSSIGMRIGSELIAVSTASPTVHIGIDPSLDSEQLREVGDSIARAIQSHAIPVRALVARSTTVDAVWRTLAETLPDPTVDRRSQPIYAAETQRFSNEPGNEVRKATVDDIELVVQASAEMYREELEIDPMKRDERWFRSRVLELIENGNSWIWLHNDRLVFKCELAASAMRAVQLMGVWTDPDLRRRGFARRGLSQVCRQLSDDHDTVSLFVNDYNTAARRLYDSLGFTEHGEMRALIW